MMLSSHHPVGAEKQANTSPRLCGKVLACHAAGLLFGQELDVRHACQNQLLCYWQHKGQQPVPP
jgi:hypothetical protein